MMLIDMEIALGGDVDVDQRMARELLQHMVEKADAGRDFGRADPSRSTVTSISVSLVLREIFPARVEDLCKLAAALSKSGGDWLAEPFSVSNGEDYMKRAVAWLAPLFALMLARRIAARWTIAPTS